VIRFTLDRPYPHQAKSNKDRGANADGTAEPAPTMAWQNVGILGYRACVSLIYSATFSPMTTHAAIVLPVITRDMIEPSGVAVTV
jgi:hypothetical protein